MAERNNKHGKIVVDHQHCVGCQICIPYCPTEVLAIADTLTPRGYYPVYCVDESRCTACAICARMCPTVAISVYRVDG